MIAYYLRLIGQFYQDMRHQKLRTFLTVFGITWGTIAVILLLAFGVGIEAYSMRAMHGLGTNIVIAGGRTTSKSFKGLNKGRNIAIRSEDARYLLQNIPEMESISPEAERWGVKAKYGRQIRQIHLRAVNPEYGDLRNVFPEMGGRFINQPDFDAKRRVIFLGNELRDQLFGEGSSPEGRTVMLNGSPFTVVGVMMKKIQNNMYSGPDAESGFIPFSTYAAMYDADQCDELLFRARSPEKTQLVIDEMYRLLGKKYTFDPTDKQALWAWNTAEGDKFIYYFFLGFKIFLGAGGFLTLLVGGIGVANIMYIVVRERRREIGVKMALGASPKMILMQFMVETFMIVGLGGVMGFGFSWGVVRLFTTPLLSFTAKYIGVPTINPLVAAITITVIGLIGFAAGFAPARRAARMNPVQALEF